MNTRMIEVALGLALVFAMTSLLLTAVRELWAAAWGSRGKVLMRALVSFVGDDEGFARALMQHPLLLSLTKEVAGGKPRPSYMSADIVIASLLASLMEHCPEGRRPASPAEFVKTLRQVVDNAAAAGAAAPTGLVPNATFVRGMASLMHGVESDWDGFQRRLCAWYDSVTDRSTGWFKRNTQASLLVFGFVVAAVANINPILIASRLWDDAPLREAISSAAQDAARTGASSQAAASTVVASPASGKTDDCVSLGDAQVQTFCRRLKDIHGLKSLGLPMGWNPLVVPEVFGEDCAAAPADPAAGGAKVRAEPSDACKLERAGNWVLVVIGWVVTAVAVSLGAPFWFDALGKIAELRTSGPPSAPFELRGVVRSAPPDREGSSTG